MSGVTKTILPYDYKEQEVFRKLEEIEIRLSKIEKELLK